jgi:methionyl aminopeptidase
VIQALNKEELNAMGQAGKIAAGLLQQLNEVIKVGITTKDIENFFVSSLEKYKGMEPAFKGFHGYPANLCVSVNEEVIHGIPSLIKSIHDGDVVSVDLGIKYQGVFVDTAYTYLIGNVSAKARKLVEVTYKALQEGINQVKIGAKIGDIGWAIQKFVSANQFSVIRKFVGHGIGRELHLPPEVPNFGIRGQGEELKENCAIAIEPMIVAGNYDIDILNDGWTVKTKDNSLAAHFEHTIVITENGPWVVTV